MHGLYSKCVEVISVKGIQNSKIISVRRLLTIYLFGILIGFVIIFLQLKQQGAEERIREEELREFLKKENMSITREYECYNILQKIDVHFIVDDFNKQVVLSTENTLIKIPFHEIIGCEIFSDQEVAGGVGRALVGGILAGSTGAIVGAQTAKKHVNSYVVVIYRDNISTPQNEIVLINQKILTSDTNYSKAVSFAQDVNATVKAILSQNQKVTDIKTENSNSTQKIKEYKELLDLGAITEEEFNSKKKELLGL